MAKMTLLLFKVLDMFLLTTSFIEIYLDASLSPKPHRLTTILLPTATSTTVFRPTTTADNSFIVDYLDTPSSPEPRQPSLIAILHRTTTTTSYQPTTTDRVSDIAENLCKNNSSKPVRILVYTHLLESRNCTNEDSTYIKYNEFLDVFYAKPLSKRMCKKKKLLKRWLLMLYDSDGDGDVKYLEYNQLDQDYIKGKNDYIQSRKGRRKRHLTQKLRQRKLGHRRSHRNPKEVHIDDR